MALSLEQTQKRTTPKPKKGAITSPRAAHMPWENAVSSRKHETDKAATLNEMPFHADCGPDLKKHWLFKSCLDGEWPTAVDGKALRQLVAQFKSFRLSLNKSWPWPVLFSPANDTAKTRKK